MDDPVERPYPFVPVLLAWLIPGAGHLKIGRLWPGVFTFATILPLYVGGMALAGFENVSYERHQVWFLFVHVFGGVLTGAAEFLTRGVQIHEALPDKTTGELFTAMACLLNVIAVTDVWSRCSRGDPEERAAARAKAALEAESAGAPPAAPGEPAAPPTAEASGG
jgi:hypothetical protein